jgi:hypothetical protein
MHFSRAGPALSDLKRVITAARWHPFDQAVSHRIQGEQAPGVDDA